LPVKRTFYFDKPPRKAVKATFNQFKRVIVMNYWKSFKDSINPSMVVSAIVAAVILGVGGYVLKQLKIKPVTDAVNVATKGAKK
jgi:uncharacterized protein HemX